MRAFLIALSLFSAASVPASELNDPVRANYLFSCRGCHLADGRGVPPEVPTLRDTLGRLISSQEGREYLVRVPGVAQSRLDDAELAAVLNYVLLEFNKATLPEDFRPYTKREVSKVRKQLLADPEAYRRTLSEASTLE